MINIFVNRAGSEFWLAQGLLQLLRKHFIDFYVPRLESRGANEDELDRVILDRKSNVQLYVLASTEEYLMDDLEIAFSNFHGITVVHLREKGFSENQLRIIYKMLQSVKYNGGYVITGEDFTDTIELLKKL